VYVIVNRRCEVEGCHNRIRVAEIPFYGGRVMRVCPECAGKLMVAFIQSPPVERRIKGEP